MTFPHLDIYTDSLPENSAADSEYFINRYAPKYKDDVGIHKHEEKHNTQWWVWFILGIVAAVFCYLTPQFNQYWYVALIVGFLIHQVLYTFVSYYRLWAEVQAYREQAKWYPDDRLPLFSTYISENYRLNITPEDALKRLKA